MLHDRLPCRVDVVNAPTSHRNERRRIGGSIDPDAILENFARHASTREQLTVRLRV